MEVKIDASAPTITGKSFPVANAAGWNTGAVDVKFTCTDAGGSGLVSCGPDTRITADGKDQVVTGTAVDTAGNTATATVTVNVDATAPVTVATVPSANTAGWYAGATSQCATISSEIYAVGNATTGASLYTLWTSEVDAAIQYGFADKRGAQFRVGVKPGNGLVGLHRMYLATTKDFMVVQETEVAALVKLGYEDQGKRYYVPAASSACTVPVYQFVKNKMHRLAATAAERASLKAAGYTEETVAFNAAPMTPVADTLAPVTVTLAATDNLSGVAATYASVDGAPEAKVGRRDLAHRFRHPHDPLLERGRRRQRRGGQDADGQASTRRRRPSPAPRSRRRTRPAGTPRRWTSRSPAPTPTRASSPAGRTSRPTVTA